MINIVHINLHKLKFIFPFTSLICAILTGVLLIFAANDNQFPDTQLLKHIAIVSLLIIPLIVCIVAVVTWYKFHKKQEEFFEEVKDSHLIPIGLSPSRINCANKWKLADDVYEMQINHWKIILRQPNNQKADVQFCFYKSDVFSENRIERSYRISKLKFYTTKFETINAVLAKMTVK